MRNVCPAVALLGLAFPALAQTPERHALTHIPAKNAVVLTDMYFDGRYAEPVDLTSCATTMGAHPQQTALHLMLVRGSYIGTPGGPFKSGFVNPAFSLVQRAINASEKQGLAEGCDGMAQHPTREVILWWVPPDFDEAPVVLAKSCETMGALTHAITAPGRLAARFYDEYPSGCGGIPGDALP